MSSGRRRGRAVLVALAVVVAAGAVAARSRRERTWRAPAFSFVDQNGRTVTDAALRGRPWIADFIFTSCSSACPLLTARMMVLQRRLADADVRFVSFSVDPERDTPAVLRGYARKWHGDDARWHLLATTPGPLAEVATGLHALAAQAMHSSRFVLVDAAGVVRGSYDSTDDVAMRRLAADAAALAPRATPNSAAHALAAPNSAAHSLAAPNSAAHSRAAPSLGRAHDGAAHDGDAHDGAAHDGDAHDGDAPEGAAREGAALFATLGCAGCHADGGVARPLVGLYGTRVALDDGRSVVADDAYLRESIVDPLAKIVAGAPPSMPSYAGVLDARELDALVAYLASLAPRSVGAR